MNYVFSHAGEEHTDVASSSTHLIQDWYVALPLFLISIALIAYLTWLVSNRNRNITLGVTTFILLITGLTTFSLSPAVSIVSILLGLAFSLFAAFTSIIN